jgi:hypothetical protein
MKTINVFRLILTAACMPAILFLISCKSGSDANGSNGDPSTETGDNLKGTNFVPIDIAKMSSSFIPINTGDTPPQIEGIYKINSISEIGYQFGNSQLSFSGCVKTNSKLFRGVYRFLTFLIANSFSDNEKNIELDNANILFRYSGQDNKTHTINTAMSATIDFQADGASSSCMVIDSIHSKKYIQGSGNEFTTYDEFTYTSKASAKTYKLGLIVSGEKSTTGITNLKACLSVENDVSLRDFFLDIATDGFCAARDLKYIDVDKDVKPNLDQNLNADELYGSNQQVEDFLNKYIEAGKDSLAKDVEMSKVLDKFNKYFEGINGVDELTAGNHIYISFLGSELETVNTWPKESMVKIPAKQMIEFLDKTGISKSLGFTDDKRTTIINIRDYISNTKSMLKSRQLKIEKGF